MSRNLRFGALLLGMALALSGCGDKAPAPGGGGTGAGGGGGAGGGAAVRLAPPVADELARLVPANAFGVVYAPSIDKLIAKLKSVVVSIDAQAAQGIDAGPLLEQLAGPAAPHVDTSRPMAIVLTPGPGKDDPPSPTFLLPVRDGAAAKASFGEMPPGASGPVVVGSYLAMSQGPGFKAGTAPSALVKDLPAGDIVVRLDLARVVETYRPMIDEGMGQLSKGFSDAGSESGGPGPVSYTHLTLPTN